MKRSLFARFKLNNNFLATQKNVWNRPFCRFTSSCRGKGGADPCYDSGSPAAFNDPIVLRTPYSLLSGVEENEAGAFVEADGGFSRPDKFQLVRFLMVAFRMPPQFCLHCPACPSAENPSVRMDRDILMFFLSSENMQANFFFFFLHAQNRKEVFFRKKHAENHRIDFLSSNATIMV